MARSLNTGYCLSRQGILKWLEIIFCVVVLGLIADGKDGYGGYPYILAASAFCAAATFILLILIFVDFKWKLQFELYFNVFCTILMLVAFGLAIYCCLVLWGHVKDGKVNAPTTDWKERMAAVAAFSGAAGLVYLYDALLASKGNAM